MQIVREFLSQGRIETALDRLEQIIEPYHANDVLLLKSRYSANKRAEWNGGSSNEEIRRENNSITNAILELCKEKSTGKPVNSEPIIETKPEPMSKLKKFNEIFEALHKDYNGENFTKNVVLQYITDLNNVFENTAFSAYARTLNAYDWDDLTRPERVQRCKEVLDAFIQNEEKLRLRISGQQAKLNNTITLDESIQLFFDRPSIKSWLNLSTQLTERFQNAGLYDPAVLTAFNNWKNKLNELTDELSFAMDFNFEYREDFGAFLRTNLNPKNFNY